MPTPILPLVLYIDDVCAALGISRWTLQRMRRSGRCPLPWIEIGGREAVSRAALERFVETGRDQRVLRKVG